MDLSGKTPAQAASLIKAHFGGVKREAETVLWNQYEKAKEANAERDVAFWKATIDALLENREDPIIPTVEPVRKKLQGAVP